MGKERDMSREMQLKSLSPKERGIGSMAFSVWDKARVVANDESFNFHVLVDMRRKPTLAMSSSCRDSQHKRQKFRVRKRPTFT